jgi:hypothetical protein
MKDMSGSRDFVGAPAENAGDFDMEHLLLVHRSNVQVVVAENAVCGLLVPTGLGNPSSGNLR